MNWDRIQGEWRNHKGTAREKWSKLTDSDWEMIAGKKDQLMGKLQAYYGWSKDQVTREIDKWMDEVQRMQPAGTSSMYGGGTGTRTEGMRTDKERQRKVS